MDDPDLAEYQGRRRASVPDPGRVRGPVLVAGAVAAAVLVVLSLVVIVLTAPQKPRVPVTADPAPAATPPAAPDSGSPAAPSPSAPSPSPSPTPAPSRPPVRHSTRTPRPLVQPLSYEAEAPGSVLSRGARVAPMDGASGASGVYALGAPNRGTLRFTGIAGGAGGRYTVTVYFQNPDPEDRSGQLTVNGGAAVTLRYPSTGGCCVRSTTASVVLDAGTVNMIEFSNPEGRSADIDRIVLSPS